MLTYMRAPDYKLLKKHHSANPANRRNLGYHKPEVLMKLQKLAIVLTVLNLAILTVIHAKSFPARAQVQTSAEILRGRGLEIVDNQGRLRASITLQPPVEQNGKEYKETILFRLISPEGKPMVKIGAAQDGSGMTLIDAGDEGVIVHADRNGASIKMTNGGKERLLEP